MENTNEASRSLASAIDIGFLDPKKAEFYVTAGGFTGLRYEGNDYKRITLRRAFPIGKPSEYISVADKDNKEIGIIRSLAGLDKDQYEIVVAELESATTVLRCTRLSPLKTN